MNKLVSVIIPVYNCEKYLAPLVESVLAQTYTNLEIIMINDGSTDRSLVICESFAQKDSRVRVKNIPNSGSSVARNTGIEMATGEYIMFADSDDLVDNTIVEELYRALVENEVNVSVALGRKVRPDLTPIRTSDVVDGTVKVLVGEEKLHFIFDHVAPWAKLYRRSLFEKFQFRKGIVHQDFDLIPKIVFEQDKIAYISKRLYSYILREDSVTGKNAKIRKPDLFIIIDKSIDEYWNSGKYEKNEELELFIAEYLLHGYSRFKRVVAQGDRKIQTVYMRAYQACYKKHSKVIKENSKLSSKDKRMMLFGARFTRLYECVCRGYLKLRGRA